jgi:hypothetical protein
MPSNSLRSVCMFPGCRMSSVTELRRPLPSGDKTLISLCSVHRRTYDALSLRDIEVFPWEQRVKR